MKKMPQRIKATRKAMRLSQKELASLVGTDQAHISRIENGEVTPSAEALTKIAHQLDMTLSQLTGEDTLEAQKAYGTKHPAYKILKDAKAPEGLKALVNDRELVNALRVTEDEWKSLGSIKLPGEVSKDGYVQLLITVRAIS